MNVPISDKRLCFLLRGLDLDRYGGEHKAEITAEVVAMIRERGGHYDRDGIRYVARGEELYRTLPT